MVSEKISYISDPDSLLIACEQGQDAIAELAVGAARRACAGKNCTYAVTTVYVSLGGRILGADCGYKSFKDKESAEAQEAICVKTVETARAGVLEAGLQIKSSISDNI